MTSDFDKIRDLIEYIDARTEYAADMKTKEEYEEWRKKADIVMEIIDQYLESDNEQNRD